MPDQPLLVLTTLPDTGAAESLAVNLIANGLAACISIGEPVRSLYHWRGQTETATEVPLSIKSTRETYPRLEAAIRARHPYEVPEIIAVPIVTGFAPYLAWLAECCGRRPDNENA
jgi:periplasmic divalent cation tolerance protein